MLEQQVAAAEQDSETNGLPTGAVMMGRSLSMGGMAPGQSDAEPLKSLDVSLDGLTVLEIAGIAFLLSSAAGMVATRKITHYEPIKILMERN